jgi:hypothetical protein
VRPGRPLTGPSSFTPPAEPSESFGESDFPENLEERLKSNDFDVYCPDLAIFQGLYEHQLFYTPKKLSKNFRKLLTYLEASIHTVPIDGHRLLSILVASCGPASDLTAAD